MLNKKMLLLGLMAVSFEALYFFFFLFKFPLLRLYQVPTDIGELTYYTQEAFWMYIGIFSLLFLLFCASYYIVKDLSDKKVLWFIMGAGFIFAMTLIFVYPLTATDLYSYVAQSKILTFYHKNPIFVTAFQYPQDQVLTLAGAWGHYGSPYGPLGILINAVPWYVSFNNVFVNLVLLKLMYSLFSLGTAYFVYKIMLDLRPKMALASALFIAWNPLILYEVSINGHNDIAMMFLTIWGLYLFLKKYYRLGIVLVMFSGFIKFATFLLVPLFIVYAITHLPSVRQRLMYVLYVGLAGIIMGVLLYFPFWGGPETLTRPLFENKIYLQSFGSLALSFASPDIQYATAIYISRIIFFAFYIYCLVLATGEKKELPRACFYAMLFFLAFGASNFKIWYTMWPVILAAATPRIWEQIGSIIFAYCSSISAAFFSYILMWLPELPKNFYLVNNSAYILTFIPVLTFLMVQKLVGLKKLHKERIGHRAK